jgi:hypothetical protein
VALKPEQDDVFLREVDDAVRQDQLASFAKRYGAIVAVGIVALLAAFGGWLYYGQHSERKAGERGETYVQALDRIEGGNPKVAADALAELKTAGTPPYDAAARFTQANVALEAGDKKRAGALLGAIAADASVDQVFRDLATVRQTAVAFDTLKPDAIIARLKPLATSDSPWFGPAAEMTAIAHLRKKERGEAGRIFADIAAHEGIEPSLKSRAVQMAGTLGIDAVAADDSKTRTAGQPTG